MTAVLSFIRWMWQQAWRAAPGPTIAVIVVNALMAALPALQVVAIAAYIRALSTATAFGDTAPSFVLLILLIAFSGPLSSIELILQLRAVDLIKLRLVRDMADTIAGLTPQELASADVAERIEKANTAAQDELPARFGYMVTLIRDVIAVSAVIATLAAMSWLAALLVLLSLVPIVLAANRATSINVTLWDSIGGLYWRARYLHQNLVAGATSRELNSLGAAPRMGALVSDVYTEITDHRRATYGPILRVRLLTALISAGILAAALIALTSGVHYGPVAAGGVYGIMAAMGTVGGLGQNMGAVVESVAPHSRFQSLQELRRPIVAHRAVARVEELRAHGITQTYPGADRPSLVDFDLTAKRGEIIALVGVNGAGKTTAVNCLLGSLAAQAGAISADDLVQASADASEWGSRFGVLTQEFGKYELTVRESLLLGATHADGVEPAGSSDTGRTDADRSDQAVPSDDALWAALEAADAADLVRSFPNGLDQQLGSQWPDGIGISGGQWQRLSLARIFLRDAPIWILDEPTSAIDAESEQEIFRTLQRAREDRITIVVSHRAWTLRGMDRILVLEGGRTVEQGTYEELVARGGRFAEIFSEQIG